MLLKHFSLQEKKLLADYQIPSSSGHSIHQGSPREHFIKAFLQDHLSESVAIGTGEIIDANSKPGEPRNQIDIIIYKRNYPKIHFGDNYYGFLVESVVATIEVKSTLDSDDIKQSIQTARRIKNLKKNMSSVFLATSYQPPSILNYVVAYQGPVKMKTVHTWIEKVHKSENIIYPAMSDTLEKRMQIPSPSIDAVFILGRGFLYFDNAPVTFVEDDARKQFPERRWILANDPSSNLLLFFLFLTTAVSGYSFSQINLAPYIKDLSVIIEHL